ncbi:MAG TPA: hypothetical protein VGP86_08700 [Xanthobacteraceae bacterium]|jgi:hypothetical protein|nr:hypothetical protein [Xanthobacteraceae bacterium]
MLEIKSLQSAIAADPKQRTSGGTEAAQKSESVSDMMRHRRNSG